VSRLQLQFDAGSLHLPELGLWLDSHLPQRGPERVFVSHAHSDHIAAHREVILSAPTARLMRERLGAAAGEHLLAFGECTPFSHGVADFQLTLLPAGHIFGSAMSLIRAEGRTLLYTGDFKLRRGRSAEPCQPQPADILVMETTFGRPHYVFPPTDTILQAVLRFCHETLDNDETPVLLGYSLGKSQELLCSLGDSGLPLMLHGNAWSLTRIYEQFGHCFPKYERYAAESARGKVLLCPPNVLHSPMLRRLGKIRTAILTGWAVDANCRYRYQCDAAFPLSDHADFPDLVEMVRQVNPKRVYTLHGFAAEFAQHLRDLGYEAQALSEDEQLALPFGKMTPRPSPPKSNQEGTPRSRGTDPEAALHSSPPETSAPDSFGRFSEACSQISQDPRKSGKVRLLAEYLASLTLQDLAVAATWFSGSPFPSSQNKVLQLGWAILRNALGVVAQVTNAELHRIYLKHSDLGETAAEICGRAPDGPSLTLTQVDTLFHQLQAARGPLAKTPLLIRALNHCTSLEAKFLVKIITGDLRIGLKEGLVEEAIAAAFARPADEVRQANLMLGHVGETAKLAALGRLKEATLLPFRPIKFMLASPEPTAAQIWQRLQAANPPTESTVPLNVWLEDKYDGIRCQLHKVGARVALYSRDLKDITPTFPELADGARAVKEDFILDGEIVARRGEEILPFAELQKRLGRREADLFMGAEVPIRFVAFDLLWLAGQSLLDRSLRERRRILETAIPTIPGFSLAHIAAAASPAEIDAAFDAARARGNEGLMIKEPASLYTPGRRGLAWLKLKKAFATLDCVVVGAEYGHGKRNRVLSDYTFAVRDEATGDLKTIGKAYTGLTDDEIARLTAHFLSSALRQRGRFFQVRPDTVLEIAFDRIQASNRHSSGLALRFPRIVRIRTDKSVEEADTLATARKLAQTSETPAPR
jgi:DNA ligase-1